MNEYEVGECVAISNAIREMGLHLNDVVGIVLAKELIELDQELYEWLYTISLPNLIDDFWPYEIKPVNLIKKQYNNMNQQEGENSES